MGVKGKNIGVIGIGKLGLCLALLLDKAGHLVIGVDVSRPYVDGLNAKTHTSVEPEVDLLLANAQNFTATTSLDEMLAISPELIFVVVATPSMPDGGYDHRQVDRVLEALAERGKTAQPVDVVVVCTTMPGYCAEAAEKVSHLGYRLSYNPEFIAQGRIIYDLLHPDQVLIGEADADAGAAIQETWETMVENQPTFCRMKPISAEICKIATNCFLTTKISFANSIGDLAVTAGAEPDKILAAIGADSRIGGKYLNYGFGYGGPCFPRDNRALGKFADDTGYELLISKATDQVNQRHLEFQFQQWMAAHGPNEPIYFDSVTYKPGTVILEESQQLALAVKLAHSGRIVVIRDTPMVINAVQAMYGDLFTYEEIIKKSP